MFVHAMSDCAVAFLGTAPRGTKSLAFGGLEKICATFLADLNLTIDHAIGKMPIGHLNQCMEAIERLVAPLMQPQGAKNACHILIDDVPPYRGSQIKDMSIIILLYKRTLWQRSTARNFAQGSTESRFAPRLVDDFALYCHDCCGPILPSLW
jgi:hypothetical protein